MITGKHPILVILDDIDEVFKPKEAKMAVIFHYYSTMLPTDVDKRIDNNEIDEDEFATFQGECRDLFELHSSTAEFRFELLTLDDEGDEVEDEEDSKWLIKQLRPFWDGHQLMQVIYQAINDGWGDEAMVMAVYYGRRWPNEPERVIGAVQSEEWAMDYNSDESEAYVDYAKKKLEDDGESVPDALDGYIDWEKMGRDAADGCIRFVDDDYYVFSEWH